MFSFRKKSGSRNMPKKQKNMPNRENPENPENPEVLIHHDQIPPPIIHIIEPDLPTINIIFSNMTKEFTEDEMLLLGTHTNYCVELIDRIKKSADNDFVHDLDKLEYWLGKINSDHSFIANAKLYLNQLHQTLHNDRKNLLYARQPRFHREDLLTTQLCDDCAEAKDNADPTDGNSTRSSRYLTASKQLCDDFNVGVIGPHVNRPDRLRVNTTRARQFVTGTSDYLQQIEQEEEVLIIQDVTYQIRVDDDMFSESTSVAQRIQIILHQMCRHVNNISDLYSQEGIGNNKARESDCLFLAGFAPSQARRNGGNWSFLYSNWDEPLTPDDWSHRGLLKVVTIKPRKRQKADIGGTRDDYGSEEEQYQPTTWYCDSETCLSCDKII
ncbi:MAG: hypothetical protein KAH18_11675 [Psychromonas sp.]|nr:hypothetical protein [Psychromonas sp.]